MSTPPTLTHELLSRYLCGDFEAERRLFERCHHALLERARRHPLARAVNRPDGPEEAVQEVFWRALSSGIFARFEDRGRGSLEALLASVLDRTLIDLGRRARTMKRGGATRVSSLDDAFFGAGHLSQPNRDPTPTASARQVERIRQCRHALSQREWNIWWRVELGGWSPADAAAEFNESPAAARGLLLRARRKLAEALQENGE